MTNCFLTSIKGTLLCLCCLLAAVANAQSAGKQPGNPLVHENALVAGAYAAAFQNRDADVDALLSADSEFQQPIAKSILLARRAMMLCGNLQNENQYPRAIAVAQRAIAQLARMTENSDLDREERLYWEALLESRILDNKHRALALLEEAEKLCPDDKRLLHLDLELSAAVEQFGR